MINLHGSIQEKKGNSYPDTQKPLLHLLYYTRNNRNQTSLITLLDHNQINEQESMILSYRVRCGLLLGNNKCRHKELSVFLVKKKGGKINGITCLDY